MSDMTVSPKAQIHRSVKLAVLLQCIPLLGAASCVFGGGTGPALTILPLFLWWSVLFWGFGYLYLRRRARFLLTLLLGPVLAFGSCVASFRDVNYDFEHFRGDYNTAAVASAETGLIVTGAVLLLAVDAWRLAEADNAAFDVDEPPRWGPPGDDEDGP